MACEQTTFKTGIAVCQGGFGSYNLVSYNYKEILNLKCCRVNSYVELFFRMQLKSISNLIVP